MDKRLTKEGNKIAATIRDFRQEKHPNIDEIFLIRNFINQYCDRHDIAAFVVVGTYYMSDRYAIKISKQVGDNGIAYVGQVKYKTFKQTVLDTLEMLGVKCRA